MKKPLSFIRAATFVAGTVMAVQALGSGVPQVSGDVDRHLSWSGIQQAPSLVTASSLMTIDAGQRVNIQSPPAAPSQDQQVELGAISVVFFVDNRRVSSSLRDIEGVVSSKYHDLDIRHATLISVHEVFADLNSSTMKSDLNHVAQSLSNRIQQRLDQAYAGRSPYIIDQVRIDDACPVVFGLTSNRCTPAMVSGPALALGREQVLAPTAQVRKTKGM